MRPERAPCGSARWLKDNPDGLCSLRERAEFISYPVEAKDHKRNEIVMERSLKKFRSREETFSQPIYLSDLVAANLRDFTLDARRFIR